MKFGDLSAKAPNFVVLRQQVTFVTHCCIAVVASPYLTAYTFGLTWSYSLFSLGQAQRKGPGQIPGKEKHEDVLRQSARGRARLVSG